MLANPYWFAATQEKMVSLQNSSVLGKIFLSTWCESNVVVVTLFHFNFGSIVIDLVLL